MRQTDKLTVFLCHEVEDWFGGVQEPLPSCLSDVLRQPSDTMATIELVVAIRDLGRPDARPTGFVRRPAPPRGVRSRLFMAMTPWRGRLVKSSR